MSNRIKDNQEEFEKLKAKTQAGAARAMELFGGFDTGNVGGGLAGTIINRYRATDVEKAALSLAEEMKGAGASARDIHAKTGWFQWPSTGEWVTEFSDAVAKYKPMWNPFKGLLSQSHEPMREVLDHPELYKRFPELAEAPVERKGLVAGLADNAVNEPGFPFSINLGSFDLDTNEVVMQFANASGSARSTLLHEIAGHGVQKLTGLPNGTNTEAVREAARARMKFTAETASQLEGPYRYWTALENGASHVEAMKGLTLADVKMAQRLGRDTVFDYVNNAQDTIAAFRNLSKKAGQGYRHTDGEAMARLVEKRSNLTDDGLRSRFPLDDLDVDPKKLIPPFADGLLTPGRQRSLVDAWK